MTSLQVYCFAFRLYVTEKRIFNGYYYLSGSHHKRAGRNDVKDMTNSYPARVAATIRLRYNSCSMTHECQHVFKKRIRARHPVSPTDTCSFVETDKTMVLLPPLLLWQRKGMYQSSEHVEVEGVQNEVKYGMRRSLMKFSRNHRLEI
eukprot:scaffold8050_cov116-Cylindrotheca_fusiformis.AAC.3